MYINEHYIDHVYKWDKNAKFTVQESQPANYVSVKEGKESVIDHKITFLIERRDVALVLKEFFANSTFNVVSITDFYIDEYNGIISEPRYHSEDELISEICKSHSRLAPYKDRSVM